MYDSFTPTTKTNDGAGPGELSTRNVVCVALLNGKALICIGVSQAGQ